MININIQKNFLRVALAGAFLLSSCSEKDYSSYCPTWLGFTYTLNNDTNPGNTRNVFVKPGDTIHLTAHQDKKGHLINATDYTWTICFDTLDANSNPVHVTQTVSKHTNYDGYADGSDDPVGHLFLPANAVKTTSKPDTIVFVARYSYSGQGVVVENGTIMDNTYSGRITPKSGPTGGGAVGYFYFNVD